MNQKYHLIMNGSKRDPIILRTPHVEGQKYNSATMFHEIYDRRQFLEQLGIPFAMATVTERSQAEDLLLNGRMINGEHWFAPIGYTRDDSAVFILTLGDYTPEHMLELLGMRMNEDPKLLRTNLAKWDHTFKVSKYMKRLWSHHRSYIQGTVIEDLGDVIKVKLDNGEDITVRYADYGKLVDGMNLVASRLMSVLPVSDEVKLSADTGTGLRLTVLSPKGFSKGHAIVLGDLEYDLVLFNSKKLLFGDRFTLGMDALHSGGLYTDAQSIINFQMYNTPMLGEWAEKFMREVLDAIQDEEKIRHMLGAYGIDFHKDSATGQYYDKEKGWALERMLQGGVGIKQHPAGVRKVSNLFMKTVMSCEYGPSDSKGRTRSLRIPVPPECGCARYIMVDPTIFDTTGTPSLAGVLRGYDCAVRGHQGEVVIHRQPNAHRGEAVKLDAVANPWLMSMDTGTFIFVSCDSIEEVCEVQGGGDQDDREVIYTDKRMVDHLKSLPTYFVEPKQVKKEVKQVPNRFMDLASIPVYDKRQLITIIANQEQQRVNIGQAVNPIMFDTLITDERRQIMDYLYTLIGNPTMDQAKLQKAWDVLEEFKGNRLITIASNLEQIIDAVKRDGADVRAYAKQILDFWAWLPVCPEVFLRGGFENRGRLPISRRDENHPIVVKTNLDYVFDDIKKMRQELEDMVTILTWQMCEHPSMEILTDPTRTAARPTALAIKMFYGEQLREIMAKVPEDDIDGRIQGFIKVDENTYNQFKDHPQIIDAMVELYAIVYDRVQPTAPIDEQTGRPKPYPDGILWGPRMSGLTIEMLDRVGLAGRYVEATIYKQQRKYFRHAVLDVNIKDGVITQEGTNVEIGMIDPIADGKAKLDHGLVKVPSHLVIPKLRIPPPSVSVYTVVNGMFTRNATPEEVQAWTLHGVKQEHVHLKPYKYMGADMVEEHAVAVVLVDSGVVIGNLTREDAPQITELTEGWLTRGNTPRTMRVIVKGGR